MVVEEVVVEVERESVVLPAVEMEAEVDSVELAAAVLVPASIRSPPSSRLALQSKTHPM